MQKMKWSKIWDSQIGPKIVHFPKVEYFFVWPCTVSLKSFSEHFSGEANVTKMTLKRHPHDFIKYIFVQHFRRLKRSLWRNIGRVSQDTPWQTLSLRTLSLANSVTTKSKPVSYPSNGNITR